MLVRHGLDARRRLAQSLKRPQTRHFSLAGAVESGCSLTHDAITLLHATTGLSWAWTIPLTALCVRTLCVLPLEAWARKHRYRAAEVRPLQYVRQATLRNAVRRENRNLPIAAQNKLFLERARDDRKQLWKQLGIKMYPAFAPFAQLPLWLLIMETFRKMCGAPQGLLGLLTTPKVISESADTEIVTTAANSALFEPSFATEGALWFPNLLVSDPQLVLPFVLSAVLFTNVSRNVGQQKKEGIQMSKGTSWFTRFLQVFSLAVGPLTLSMPSAMHVYWISSSVWAIMHDKFLLRIQPRPPTVTPCKGPAGNSTKMENVST